MRLSRADEAGVYLGRALRAEGVQTKDIEFLAERPVLLAHIKALIAVRRREESKEARKVARSRETAA